MNIDISEIPIRLERFIDLYAKNVQSLIIQIVFGMNENEYRQAHGLAPSDDIMWHMTPRQNDMIRKLQKTVISLEGFDMCHYEKILILQSRYRELNLLV